MHLHRNGCKVGPLPVINGVATPYKFMTGLITPINGVITLLTTYNWFLGPSCGFFHDSHTKSPGGDPIIQGKTPPSREKCLRRTDGLPLLFVKLLLEKSVRKVRGWVVFLVVFQGQISRDICDIPELSLLKFSPEVFFVKHNAKNAGEIDLNGWCMYFTKGQKRREEISLKKTTKTAHNGTIFCK